MKTVHFLKQRVKAGELTVYKLPCPTSNIILDISASLLCPTTSLSSTSHSNAHKDYLCPTTKPLGQALPSSHLLPPWSTVLLIIPVLFSKRDFCQPHVKQINSIEILAFSLRPREMFGADILNLLSKKRIWTIFYMDYCHKWSSKLGLHLQKCKT